MIGFSFRRWSSAAFWRRIERGAVAHVFGDERGVLAHAVARTFDLDHDGMVQQPVEQCGGDDGIAEDVAPFGEAPVGGEDHGALFVSGVDELEEQVGAARRDRQVPDLVDDEQRCPGEEADLLPEHAFTLGFGELSNQIGERDELDRFAGAHRLDRKCRGNVALAGAGRAQQMDNFGAFDEVQAGERQDAVAIER